MEQFWAAIAGADARWDIESQAQSVAPQTVGLFVSCCQGFQAPEGSATRICREQIRTIAIEESSRARRGGAQDVRSKIAGAILDSGSWCNTAPFSGHAMNKGARSSGAFCSSARGGTPLLQALRENCPAVLASAVCLHEFRNRDSRAHRLARYANLAPLLSQSGSASTRICREQVRATGRSGHEHARCALPRTLFNSDVVRHLAAHPTCTLPTERHR